MANVKFTVGEKRVPAVEWISGMRKAGYLD